MVISHQIKAQRNGVGIFWGVLQIIDHIIIAYASEIIFLGPLLLSSSSLLRLGVDLSQMYNIKVHNNAKHSE